MSLPNIKDATIAMFSNSSVYNTKLAHVEKTGLGIEEHSTDTAFASELADPEPSVKKRETKVSYTRYSDEYRTTIGKYTIQNGNERARKHLTESTVRKFLKKYLEEMS